MPSQSEINKQLIDRTSIDSGFGSLSDAYTNMLRGINHRGLGNAINSNRDNTGIVFFTRPNLNLTYDNLAGNRLLMPLGTQNAKLTLQRYIRTALDPKNAIINGVNTPDLFDHRQPFIPLLTNNLLSVAGWPDIAVDTYQSKEGIRKESWAKIDGVFRKTEIFELTMNFRNIAGDPITTMLNAWINYAVSVTLGDMVPYPECIVENEYDYNTRIYHLVLDPSRRYVQKIAATGASFPTSNSIGASFNFNAEERFVSNTEMISANFTCMGADYNDPITVEEFNELVAIFNEDMTITSYSDDGNLTLKGNSGANSLIGSQRYLRLTGEDLLKGSYWGTPLIHPLTFELFWYVTPEIYNTRIAV
jgi:hypothetical protein